MSDIDFIEATEVSMYNLQVYQQDKAVIDMQISTAKQFPRNLKKAIDNAITIVTMDTEVATKCMYSLAKGGKPITGPSVYLAKVIAQQMGNMRIENKVVGFDATHVTCEAICFDLERNFAIRTQIKRPITGKNGRFSEDMCSIVGNAGNSIALRNAIFAVVDSSIIDKVYNSAKEKITGNLTDETKLLARVNKCVEGFKTTYPHLNLKDEEIAKSVGKASVSHITKDDTLVLIGYEASLKAGEISPEELFRPSGKITKPIIEDKSEERIILLIGQAKSKKDLELLKKNCVTPSALMAYDNAFKKLQ